MLINVLDFPDPASALLCAQHGDRVYFPGGFTYEAPPDGWTVDKSIEISGDGAGDVYSFLSPPVYDGTILTPTSGLKRISSQGTQQ